MKEYSNKAIYEKITQYADLKNKHVLEIGCGNGRISSLLVTGSCFLTAIDPDEVAIERAKQKNKNVDFRIGSGENLAFSNCSFDIIIFTLSLHHHQNSKKALNEAARVLKKDGIILIIEPVIDGEIERVFSFLIDKNKVKKEAQKSIARCELSIVDSETFTARWEFRDTQDLIHSVFQYYEMPHSPDIERKIINFLGNKINSMPIVLQDTLIIQVLKQQDQHY